MMILQTDLARCPRIREPCFNGRVGWCENGGLLSELEVSRFTEEVTAKDHVLTHLVYNKAVDRQYHSWFDWKARNANQFFVLFGTDCKNYMKTEVDKDEDLKSSILAFLEIGLERNRLAHQNFGSYSLEKKSEEVYELHKTAMRFVEWFPSAIRKFSNDI